MFTQYPLFSRAMKVSSRYVTHVIFYSGNSVPMISVILKNTVFEDIFISTIVKMKNKNCLLQIRGSIHTILFLFLHKCEVSASNEYPQHMFS